MQISQDTARKLILWKQAFHNQPNPEKSEILNIIRRLGCIQIDTINVVERSHYMTFWSRLGPYDKEHLDQLLHPDRKVFEYWAHAASIIPIEHYRYFTPTMKQNRQRAKTQAERWLKGKTHLLDEVLEQIRQNGPMSSKDFKQERQREKRTGWWNWKPAKTALEILFNAGILMVAYRKRFQRYYDLTENVLPTDTDLTEPTSEERRRFFMEKTLDAWGVAKPNDVSSYYYQWSTRASLGTKELEQTLRDLQTDDVIMEVTIKGLNDPYYMLTNDCEVAESITAGENEGFNKVTFLSPFDNLTWNRNRTQTFFNFTPKLEAYLPKEKRQYGYYNMNILYGDQIVGRLDPKAHRDKETIEVKLLHLEEDFKPDREFEGKLEDAFKSFIEFHEAERIEFRKVVPDTLKIDDFSL